MAEEIQIENPLVKNQIHEAHNLIRKVYWKLLDTESFFLKYYNIFHQYTGLKSVNILATIEVSEMKLRFPQALMPAPPPPSPKKKDLHGMQLFSGQD